MDKRKSLQISYKASHKVLGEIIDPFPNFKVQPLKFEMDK